MKVRIESDGTPAGTRVVDAATGEAIEGFTSVVICARHAAPAEAVITFEGVQIEMTVEAKMPNRKVVPLIPRIRK
jgi:hypothetical protein